MTLAIFDLDGTLYTGHITQGIARHHRVHKVKRLQYYAFFVTHIAAWPLKLLGLVPEATMRRLWISHVGWTIRGWTPEQAAPAFAWIAEQYVLPLLRPDVMERLRDHQAQGHRVIIVSGTMAPLLAEIGRQLGVEETVGTSLVLRSGRYTGACELPVCQGAGKVTRLEEHLRRADESAWDLTYAYADSVTDLALLEWASHPVAVYPDPKLATHARDQGWEILGHETTGGW